MSRNLSVAGGDLLHDLFARKYAVGGIDRYHEFARYGFFKFVRLLTLGAHAHEGYGSLSVCLSVCLSVTDLLLA